MYTMLASCECCLTTDQLCMHCLPCWQFVNATWQRTSCVCIVCYVCQMWMPPDNGPAVYSLYAMLTICECRLTTDQLCIHCMLHLPVLNAAWQWTSCVFIICHVCQLWMPPDNGPAVYSLYAMLASCECYLTDCMPVWGAVMYKMYLVSCILTTLDKCLLFQGLLWWCWLAGDSGELTSSSQGLVYSSWHRYSVFSACI